MRRLVLPLALGLVLLAGSAAGAPVLPAFPPALQEIAGAAVERPRLVLEGLDGKARDLPWSELPLVDPRTRGAWLLRPVGLVRPAETGADGSIETGGEARIRLASGDELRGRVVGGSGEELDLELVAGIRLPVEIDDLWSLVFPERIPAALDAPLEPAPEGDRLFRSSGTSLDRIDGTVEEFLPEGIRFDSDELGSRVFDWERVAALFVEVFEQEGGERAAEGTPISVDLVDGSRVRGDLVSLEESGVRMRVAGRSAVQLEWSRVVEVAVDDGRLAFLSDLAPAREEGMGAPFDDELGMVWPHRLDRSVVGRPLTVGGSRVARGIGMHAPSRVLWELDGSWAELRGAVAIDDSALRNAEGARGAVVFRVLTDGEVAWESGVVRGGDPRVTFPPVDLAGVRELVLEADAGEDFGGDRADWLRVLLVR